MRDIKILSGNREPARKAEAAIADIRFPTRTEAKKANKMISSHMRWMLESTGYCVEDDITGNVFSGRLTSVNSKASNAYLRPVIKISNASELGLEKGMEFDTGDLKDDRWMMISKNEAILKYPVYIDSLMVGRIVPPYDKEDEKALKAALEKYAVTNDLQSEKILGEPGLYKGAPVTGVKIKDFGLCEQDSNGLTSCPGADSTDIIQSGLHNRCWIKFDAPGRHMPKGTVLWMKFEREDGYPAADGRFIVVGNGVAVANKPFVTKIPSVLKVAKATLEGWEDLNDSVKINASRIRVFTPNDYDAMIKQGLKFGDKQYLCAAYDYGAEQSSSTNVYTLKGSDSYKWSYSGDTNKQVETFAVIETLNSLTPGKRIPNTSLHALTEHTAVCLTPIPCKNNSRDAQEAVQKAFPMSRFGVRALTGFKINNVKINTEREVQLGTVDGESNLEELCYTSKSQDRKSSVIMQRLPGKVGYDHCDGMPYTYYGSAPAVNGPIFMRPTMTCSPFNEIVPNLSLGELVSFGDITWKIMQIDTYHNTYKLMAVDPIEVNLDETNLNEKGEMIYEGSNIDKYLNSGFLYEHGLPPLGLSYLIDANKTLTHHDIPDLSSKIQLAEKDSFTIASADSATWEGNFGVGFPKVPGAYARSVSFLKAMQYFDDGPEWLLPNSKSDGNKAEKVAKGKMLTADISENGNRLEVYVNGTSMNLTDWCNQDSRLRIRPEMRTMNLRKLGLKPGDRFTAYGQTWIVCDKNPNAAVCTTTLGPTIFSKGDPSLIKDVNKRLTPEDIQHVFEKAYAKSEAKKVLDKWIEAEIQPNLSVAERVAESAEYEEPETEPETEPAEPVYENHEPEYDPMAVAYAQSGIPENIDAAAIQAANGTIIFFDSFEPVIFPTVGGKGVITFPISRIEGYLDENVPISIAGHDWTFDPSSNSIICNDLAPAGSWTQQQASRYTTYQDSLDQALEAAREAEGLMSDMDTMMKMDPDLNEDDISRYIGR